MVLVISKICPFKLHCSKSHCNPLLVQQSAHLSAKEQNTDEKIIWGSNLYWYFPSNITPVATTGEKTTSLYSVESAAQVFGGAQRIRAEASVDRSIWLQYISTLVWGKLLRSCSEIIFLAFQGCACAVNGEMEKLCWNGVLKRKHYPHQSLFSLLVYFQDVFFCLIHCLLVTSYSLSRL